MKKIKYFILAIVLLFSLVGCNSDTTKKEESSKNTIDWPTNFYGIEIPAPEGYSKIAVLVSEVDGFKNEVTTVRIDGMKWEEYVKYCKQLEALADWTSDEDNIAFSDNIDENTFFTFRGTYATLPKVTVTFYSEEKAVENNVPVFQMFIFKTF